MTLNPNGPVVLERDLLIIFESFTTGTPAATIIAQQTASSGMWAAGEGMEVLYLVPLFYLLRPILFDLAGQLLKSGSQAKRLGVLVLALLRP